MARTFHNDSDDAEERKREERKRRDARKAKYLTPAPVTRALRDASRRHA